MLLEVILRKPRPELFRASEECCDIGFNFDPLALNFFNFLLDTFFGPKWFNEV